MCLLVCLMAMQACLWAFLAMPLWWMAVAGAGCAALAAAVWRGRWAGQVSLGTLAVCLGAALVVLVLGGEGRFVYANTDWQVRNAVLGDLSRFDWPFAYDQSGGAKILRAPLGIYLIPALIGKWAGAYGAELALLGQNVLLLGGVLALGAGLFSGTRERLIALGVFWGFSGMDILGQLIAGKSPLLHLEGWAGLQYTAHLTQAFWVPQHAVAGWIFAVTYLLWLQGRVPRVALFAVMPLLALLSPLALMGCVPFAAHGLFAGVFRRVLSWGEVVWPGLCGVICLPGLVYLTAGSAAVGAGGAAFSWLTRITFLAFEVGLLFYAVWLARERLRFGGVAAALAVLVLVLAPLGQVGSSVDFTMRASIPALAILSLMIAAILMERGADGTKARQWALAALAIGLVTPLGEVARALVWPASPQVGCSYMGVVPGGAPTYVAAIDALPSIIRPRHFQLVRPVDPQPCWTGRWPDAATGRDSTVHGG